MKIVIACLAAATVLALILVFYPKKRQLKGHAVAQDVRQLRL
jgi:hypothetical protein